MTEPPLVSIEEFERIECNRCGQCCEGFAYVGPIQVAESMGWYASLKREDWDFTDVDRTTAWWSHIAPV